MEQKELVRKFLNLDDESEEIVEAWELFIDTNKAFRDVEARIVSRREGDNIRRKFMRYMRKNNLRVLDEETGLKAHEIALVREEDEIGGELKTVNSLDLWLLTDFKDVGTAWVAEDFRQVEDFPDTILAFLDNPYVNVRLKERLIEKDTERGEKLFTTILEDKPSAVSAHLVLVGHYERKKRMDDAEKEYKRMLTQTDDEVVWANYGGLLEKQGRYEAAFDAFKESFEVCERIGRAGDRLGTLLKESISRVERMKNLEGEEAEKAREYWESVWLIEEIRDFADEMYAREMEKAQDEYKKEKGIEAMHVEDTFDFLNWFLFSRTLEDGRTLGIVYADEKGLSDELKEKIKGLANPIRGAFEVVDVDQASFKFVVKDAKREEEYELRGNIPDLKGRLTFTGNIYPWGDLYFTESLFKAHMEEE
jgi:tetratricopeptide (TPR) repeat protein